MWTNHEEIEAVLESLVRYDEATAAGRRVMPFYSEPLSIRGATIAAPNSRTRASRAEALTDYHVALGNR
jgi:hypothetical protein